MNISEFLLARITEDELAARAVIAECEESPPSVYDMAQVPMLNAGAPDRVLAECAAKRRVVELHHDPYEGDDDYDPACTGMYDSGSAESSNCDTLRALASVYADHPDFDPNWA